MVDSIKFSIIVPCYNVESYINECVQSVINQTYGNWELLLINDASTDRTLDIIKKLETADERIHVYDKEHGGLPHTRNYGLQHVTGNYLMLLDGDDYFALEHLERDAETIRETMADMIIHNQHTNFTQQSSNQVILFPVPEREITEKEKLGIIFSKHNCLPAAAVLTTYNLDFLKKNGIRYGEQYSCSEDLDFFFKSISYDPQIVFANHEFYFYRQDNSAAMTKNISGKMELDRLSIYKNWFDYYKGKNLGDFDCQAILDKIADELLIQIHVCKNIPARDPMKKTVRKYLSRNRYLYRPNGIKGSFVYAYYIKYPYTKIKNSLLQKYSKLRDMVLTKRGA